MTCICNTVERRARNWILLCSITFMKGHMMVIIWVLFTVQHSKGLFCCLEKHTISIFRVNECGSVQCPSNWVEGIHTGLRECWPIRVTDRRRAGRTCTEPVELRDSRMVHIQVNRCKRCTSIKKVCFITSTKQIIVTNNKKLKLA